MTRTDPRHLVLAAIALFLPALALAQDREPPSAETVQLHSDQELLAGFGVLILEPHASEETPEVRSRPRVREREAVLRTEGSGRWSAHVSLESGDYQPGAKLLAVAVGSAGTPVVSSVRWLIPPKEAASDHVRCIPGEEPGQIEELSVLDPERLRKLVDVRQQRVELYGELISTMLTPKVLEQLAVLEKEYGLANEPPLSSALPLEDLVERLSALAAVRGVSLPAK